MEGGFGRRQSGTGSRGKRAATCREFTWVFRSEVLGCDLRYRAFWRPRIGWRQTSTALPQSLTLFAWLRRGLDCSTLATRDRTPGAHGCQKAHAERRQLVSFLAVSQPTHHHVPGTRPTNKLEKQPTVRISYRLR